MADERMDGAAMTLRFKLPPGDVPPAVAARQLGLSMAEFKLKLPELVADGFPPPYQITGNFYLPAIEAWQRGRYPQFFPAERLPAAAATPDAAAVDVSARLAHLRPRSVAR